jgi:hypothetical protein
VGPDSLAQDLFLFTDREDVSGTITIKPNGKPVVHEGIKIELVGQIGAGWSVRVRGYGWSAEEAACVDRAVL